MAKRKTQPEGEDCNPQSPVQDSASDARISKRPKKNTVEDLNALNADDFKERLLDDTLLQFDNEIHLEFYLAGALPPEDLDACFDLIATTSRHDYEPSSFGWHPRRKRREMLEEEMRYLVMRGRDRQFRGFVSFMLTRDSTPVVPVLYIYEIHLTRDVRGRGLGSHVMRLAEDIARRAGVDKVMLTCFRSNAQAHSFYRRMGYRTDACSPEDRKTRNKTVKVDYVIMSKDLHPSQTTAE